MKEITPDPRVGLADNRAVNHLPAHALGSAAPAPATLENSEELSLDDLDETLAAQYYRFVSAMQLTGREQELQLARDGIVGEDVTNHPVGSVTVKELRASRPQPGAAPTKTDLEVETSTDEVFSTALHRWHRSEAPAKEFAPDFAATAVSDLLNRTIEREYEHISTDRRTSRADSKSGAAVLERSMSTAAHAEDAHVERFRGVMNQWTQSVARDLDRDARSYKSSFRAPLSSYVDALSTASEARWHNATPAVREKLDAFVGALTGKVAMKQPAAELFGRWSSLVVASHHAGEHRTENIASLLNYVMREAYLGDTETLGYLADKVKKANLKKKILRSYMQQVRDYMTNLSTASAKAGVSTDPGIFVDTPGKYDEYDEFLYEQEKHRVSVVRARSFAETYANEHRTTFKVPEGAELVYRELALTDQIPGPGISFMGDIEAYSKELEEKLSSIGDDAQLANVDLQNALQKQQQGMQMMTNFSKMLMDTAMSIIRKIGG